MILIMFYISPLIHNVFSISFIMERGPFPKLPFVKADNLLTDLDFVQKPVIGKKLDKHTEKHAQNTNGKIFNGYGITT